MTKNDTIHYIYPLTEKKNILFFCCSLTYLYLWAHRTIIIIMNMKKMLFLALCALAVFSGANAQDSEKKLKEAYKDYFLIGVAVNQRNITNEEQSDLVRRSSIV